MTTLLELTDPGSVGNARYGLQPVSETGFIFAKRITFSPKVGFAWQVCNRHVTIKLAVVTL